MDLFGYDRGTKRPLAWRMQPQTLADILGQEHLLGQDRPLRALIDNDSIVSVIFYGPPGTGKTALAQIIARHTSAAFRHLNAVTSGIKEIREAVSYSKGTRAILFIDEIHRFNKVQQDALLPHIEQGEIILIGASTENPFFALVPALSSRTVIFKFEPLSDGDIASLLQKAVIDKRGLGDKGLALTDGAIDFICEKSGGDARKALNILELTALSIKGQGIDREAVKTAIIDKSIYYDRNEHYDVISAFIKSMRGSDPDAAVYWMARMIVSGEDPLFIARRIVICASEDVGNADPAALNVAVSAYLAVERIGMPEGRIPLSQAAIYVACAPKSNSSYCAIDGAIESIKTEPVQSVPIYLRDSSYQGARTLGVSGYKYPHNYPGHYVRQDYMNTYKNFYNPSSEGFEKLIGERIRDRRSYPDE